MTWQQVSPSQFERPFDTLESLYRKIASSTAHLNKQQYFITSTIKLKDEHSITDLQQAWTKLRHQHPKIATVPDETGTRLVYTVPSPQEIKDWMFKTFHVYSGTEKMDGETLDSVLPTSTQFMLHCIPSSRELLFRSPHWRIDGIGMMMLESCFLTLLSDGSSNVPTFDGSEVSRLAPGLDEAAAFSLDITDDMKHAAQTELSVFATGSPPVSIRQSLKSVTNPGTSRRASTRFSKDISEKIITASKRRSLKLTTAVQAALFLTSRQYMTPQEGSLMCFNTYNIRDRLPMPWNGPQGASSVYHTGRPCSINLSLNTDYQAFASSLRAHYEQDLQPLFGFMVPYMQSVEALLAAPYELAINAPGAAHPEISSLGIIEDRLQTRFDGPGGIIEIEDWWLGVHVVNRILQTYVWTRDGELNLACHYNDAYYDREFVERFCEKWRSDIMKEFIH